MATREWRVAAFVALASYPDYYLITEGGRWIRKRGSIFVARKQLAFDS